MSFNYILLTSTAKYGFSASEDTKRIVVDNYLYLYAIPCLKDE